MNSNGSGNGAVFGFGTVQVRLDSMPVESLANLQVEEDANGKYVTGLTVGGVPVRVRLDEVVQMVSGQQFVRPLAMLNQLKEWQGAGIKENWIPDAIAEETRHLTEVSQFLVDSVAAANPALNVYMANGRGFEVRLSKSTCERDPSLQLFAVAVPVPLAMDRPPLIHLPQPSSTVIRHAWDQSANRLLLVALCGKLRGEEQKGSLSLFLQGNGQVFQVEASADCDSGLQISSGIVGKAIAPPNVVSQSTSTLVAA